MAKLTENQVFGIALRQARTGIADTYGADPVELARAATALANVESGYRPDAKNKKSSARGIVQMLAGTQKEVENKYMKRGNNPDKIWDPEYAIALAEHYLGYQYNRYDKNWYKAVFAYNQGSYNPQKAAGADYARKWDIALNTQKLANGDYAYAPNPGNFYMEFV